MLVMMVIMVTMMFAMMVMLAIAPFMVLFMMFAMAAFAVRMIMVPLTAWRCCLFGKREDRKPIQGILALFKNKAVRVQFPDR